MRASEASLMRGGYVGKGGAMKATWSSRRPVLIALAAIITACAASTTASGRTAAGSRGSITTSTHTLQAAVDLEAGLGFREDGANNFKAVPSGTHASVPSKRFYLVATIANRGTDPSKAAIRVEVTSGLKWGTQDADNPSRCSVPPMLSLPSTDRSWSGRANRMGVGRYRRCPWQSCRQGVLGRSPCPPMRTLRTTTLRSRSTFRMSADQGWGGAQPR